MPERWSIATGNIESGLRWWGGRPEFIESSWYLYRATKDPWYLHVGEMTLRDIKRRCWTKCGWAGLQDVRTGELTDRMESFFLGETAKYLYLLFDPTHPLNTWDAPFVFTTEGHPLIIPKRVRPSGPVRHSAPALHPDHQPATDMCQLPPEPVPFSVSATAARPDIFHAASLARLHLMPTIETLDSPLVEFSADHPSISISDIRSPSNYTYYPWTLPMELIPSNATSSPIAVRTTFDLSFPNMPNTLQVGMLQRVHEGILVNSMSGLRLGMVREPDESPVSEVMLDEQFRIYSISNVALGRDEKVYMTRATIESFNPLDPYFTRTRDTQTIDLVIDVPPEPAPGTASQALSELLQDQSDQGMVNLTKVLELEVDGDAMDADSSYLSSLLNSLQSLLSAPAASPTASATAPGPQETQRLAVAGTLPIGPGSAPLPDVADPELTHSAANPLLWSTIYIHPNTLCDERLPFDVPRKHQIIVVPRGGCSFATKLRNIPAFPPKSSSLQLVVVVSYPEHEHPEYSFSDHDIKGKDAASPQKGSRMSKHRRESNGQDEDPAKQSLLPKERKPDPSPASKMSSKKPARSVPPSEGPPPHLAQPFIDETQYTPSGLPRPHPIPLIMVSGGDQTMNLLRRAGAVGVRRKYYFLSQGVRIRNLIVL